MSFRREAERWLDSELVPRELKRELFPILEDEAALAERFAAPLSFGTAGLRGVMGAGISRMNLLTVRWATQAMAELILREDGAARGCAVCYDTRHNSRAFAEAAAGVLAANHIHVYLFEQPSPTPELSFSVRHYGCMAGINITASHNPPAYNGYKVYWSDGAQMPPGHAAEVAAQMAAIDVLDGPKLLSLAAAKHQGRISWLTPETDVAYLRAVLAQSVLAEEDRAALKRLRVVYTPLHGTGAALVPEVLCAAGVDDGHLWPVAAQMVADGDFPTVKSPNPEDPASFERALELARTVAAELIIATDPDADRVGAMVLHGDEYRALSGNAMGALLCDYVLRGHAPLPDNALVLKSLVSTELARAVAASHGAACEDTFTGFKFMAERIAEYERTGEKQVFFSFEESYGYLPGGYVRDKDAVSASMLIAEMTAYHRARGRTLIDALAELGERCGHYAERTISLAEPGPEGAARIREMMARLRTEPPKTLAGRAVTAFVDYLPGRRRAADGTETALALSGSDVAALELADGSRVVVRPSGTEPKMKVYLLCHGASAADCARAVEELAAELPVGGQM